MPFDEWNAAHPSVNVTEFVGVQTLGPSEGTKC